MAFTVRDGVILRDQVPTLSGQLDTLVRVNEAITRLFDFLWAQASQEISSLRARVSGVAGAGARNSRHGSGQLVKLFVLKDFKLEMFSGKRDQDLQHWRKSFFDYSTITTCGARLPRGTQLGGEAQGSSGRFSSVPPELGQGGGGRPQASNGLTPTFTDDVLVWADG